MASEYEVRNELFIDVHCLFQMSKKTERGLILS